MCEICIKEIVQSLSQDVKEIKIVTGGLWHTDPDDPPVTKKMKRLASFIHAIIQAEVETVKDSDAMLAALSTVFTYLAWAQSETLLHDEKTTPDHLYAWRDHLFKLIDTKQNYINDLLIKGLQELNKR